MMKVWKIVFGAAILFCLLAAGVAQARGPHMEAWPGAPDPYAWPQPYPYTPHVYAPAHPSQPYTMQPADPGYIAYVADHSTDPMKVVDTYPLHVGDKNIRRVAHINAGRLRGGDAYAAYAYLAESYEGDYLAAFRAGEEARRLRDNIGARAWYERALSVNPYYRPALDALGGLR